MTWKYLGWYETERGDSEYDGPGPDEPTQCHGGRCHVDYETGGWERCDAHQAEVDVATDAELEEEV